MMQHVHRVVGFAFLAITASEAFSVLHQQQQFTASRVVAVSAKKVSSLRVKGWFWRIVRIALPLFRINIPLFESR